MSRLGKRKLLAGSSLGAMAAVMIMGFSTQAAPPASKPAPSPSGESAAPAAKPDADQLLAAKPAADLSGHKRIGKASFYADRFGGRKMADGRHFDLQGNNAASRTLPLGTTAKVTNLKTGLSTVVTIQDRGPYVDGRIVDLSPGTARKIGLSKKEGITRVEVTPIAVPMPDGRIKFGAAAADPQFALDLPAWREGRYGSGS